MQAIYSAATGLKGQQTRLDTIAANLANSNTPGYKSARVDFKDALYTSMNHPLEDAEAANLRKGSGVLPAAVSTSFSNGPLTATGAALDFAISGGGFFAVETPAGETVYTRSGSFGVSAGEEADYLVTSQGYYVLDRSGSRIALPDDTAGLGVTPDGVLGMTDQSIAVLKIVDFPNPDGLLSAGDSCFRESAASGAAVPAENPSVVQGSLEGSNVDLAQELTLLIRSQRAYSLASRALQTADNMEGLANNMR